MVPSDSHWPATPERTTTGGDSVICRLRLRSSSSSNGAEQKQWSSSILTFSNWYSWQISWLPQNIYFRKVSKLCVSSFRDTEEAFFNDIIEEFINLRWCCYSSNFVIFFVMFSGAIYDVNIACQSQESASHQTHIFSQQMKSSKLLEFLLLKGFRRWDFNKIFFQIRQFKLDI